VAKGDIEGTALVTGYGRATVEPFVVFFRASEIDITTVLCTHYGFRVEPEDATG